MTANAVVILPPPKQRSINVLFTSMFPVGSVRWVRQGDTLRADFESSGFLAVGLGKRIAANPHPPARPGGCAAAGASFSATMTFGSCQAAVTAAESAAAPEPITSKSQSTSASGTSLEPATLAWAPSTWEFALSESFSFSEAAEPSIRRSRTGPSASSLPP
jgi:hypothetical protein